MRIVRPEPMVLVQVSVVLICLVAAVVVAGWDYGRPPPRRFPSMQRECTACHGTGAVSGVVTAVPSPATPSPGAAYTVRVSVPDGPAEGDTGYWFAVSDLSGATGPSTGVIGGFTHRAEDRYAVTMTAPVVPGTYFYKVWASRGRADRSGRTNATVYRITVTGGSTGAPTPHVGRPSAD